MRCEFTVDGGSTVRSIRGSMVVDPENSNCRRKSRLQNGLIQMRNLLFKRVIPMRTCHWNIGIQLYSLSVCTELEKCIE